MPRVPTTNLALGTFLDGENPGAGSQTVLAGNTGLNANWLILDQSIGTEHLANGVHKSNVIDGPMLKTTSVDGSTIDLSGSPLKLRVKALGITSAQLAAASVMAGKIAPNGVSAANQFAPGVVNTAALASDAVTTVKVVDGNITTAKIANAAVTTAKFDFKEYSARVSQSGTAAPTAQLLGPSTMSAALVWTRVGAGAYTLTLLSEFTANKTLVLITPADTTWSHPSAIWADASNITILNRDPAGALADGWQAMILIRVYP